MPEYQLAERRKAKLIIHEPLKLYTDYKLPWKSIKYRAHDANWENLLWPEKRTREWLEAEREKYVAQGMPEVYSQEYLNVPIDETTAFFKRKDFVPQSEDDKKKLLRYYIASDLAVSEGDRADWSVFVIGGMDESGILHIVNVVRDRMDAKQIIDTILFLERFYKPELFAMEKGQIDKAIGPFLNEEMVKSNTYPSIIKLAPSMDKSQRARSIQARVRARGVRFDNEADWYQAFEDECTRFPRDKHDDQVDAFAYLGLVIDKMVEAPTNNELADEAYQQEINLSGLNDTGRSAVTGY